MDTEEVGKKYYNNESNFHISTAGHNDLVNYILGYMYHNKFELNSLAKKEISTLTEIANKDAAGVMESTILDYEQSYKKAMELLGYSRKRVLAIANEHKRKIEVFQKVLSKRMK